MRILDAYLLSKSKKDFLRQLQIIPDITFQKAEVYYKEITELLISSNLASNIDVNKREIPLIPDDGLDITYGFGNTSITIRFGSENVKDLIHPQWSHAELHRTSSISCHFHVFKVENSLYLLKDKIGIGHYPISEYHLLQGQFAVELINILYDQKESDWLATFHASTVCNENEAIMIIGDSGNGKSTLSAVLMASGIDVLSDDFTPLSGLNSEVYRFPSGISVKEGAFKVLAPLFPGFDQFPTHKSTSKRINIKYIAPIKSFETAINHFPCKKIVYVKYDELAKSELKEIDTIKILPTLIPESWLSPLSSNSKLFLEWLKDLQCFELHYSDNAYAISQFKKLFNS